MSISNWLESLVWNRTQSPIHQIDILTIVMLEAELNSQRPLLEEQNGLDGFEEPLYVFYRDCDDLSTGKFYWF